MTALTSVGPSTDAGEELALVLPDDLSGLWSHAFPSADLVRSAGALLTPLRGWDGTEGPRARITVAPGVVRVSRHDPARAERTSERVRRSVSLNADLASQELLLEHRLEQVDQGLASTGLIAAAGLVPWSEVERVAGQADYLQGRIVERDTEHAPRGASITCWSAKSRTNMVRTLGMLDYAPLFAAGGVPAMLTFTYADDWLSVAPNSGACLRHLNLFKKRFARAYGRPLVALWKREFQRRGAPHFHLLMVPPVETVNGMGFVRWASSTWAEIVGHAGEDYAKHLVRGVDVSYAEGMRSRDPKRLAIYFSKHGAFSAKEYQNHAPQEWLDAGGTVGRFWGFWGLSKALSVVEVTDVEADAAARTMRRWQEANGYRVQREVWRKSYKVDPSTGEVTGWKWRRRKSGSWSGARMRGVSGFVMVNDGAAFVSQLAGYLDVVRTDAQDAELAAWVSSPQRLRSLET